MNKRGDAIVLIGFMGAGKSSIGRTLARITGLSRFDTDEMVAARFDLTQMVVAGSCRTTAEAVDYLLWRLLRVPAAQPTRDAFVTLRIGDDCWSAGMACTASLSGTTVTCQKGAMP